MMNERGNSKPGRRCVGQIFTLRQMGEKGQEKQSVYVSFMDLEKAYDSVNRESL